MVLKQKKKTKTKTGDLLPQHAAHASLYPHDSDKLESSMATVVTVHN